MGTVRANLTISTSDVLATPVNVQVGRNFSANSGLVMRAKVKGVAAGVDDLTIYKANDKNVSAYLYIRNLNTDLENYIYIHNATDSNAAVAKIGGGEFCYIPVPFDKTFKAYGTLVDQLIEFTVFGEDDSDTTLG